MAYTGWDGKKKTDLLIYFYICLPNILDLPPLTRNCVLNLSSLQSLPNDNILEMLLAAVN